jgi:hypothetical protein
VSEVFDKVFATGGWLGVLAALALVVAYVKDRDVRKLQALRTKEAWNTALLLHKLIPRISGRKPSVSIHEDDDVSDIVSVRDKLYEQATVEIDSDVRELLERYNRGEDI